MSRINYIEISPKQFFTEHPEYAVKLPRDVLSDILSDDRYLVRVSSDGKVEIGYHSDKWFE